MKPSTALSSGGGGEFSREVSDWEAGVGRAQWPEDLERE